MGIFTRTKGKLIIGVIHLPPLPGTPLYQKDMFRDALAKASNDARALQDGGASGCLIQSVDKIYPASDGADYSRVSATSLLAHEVRRATDNEFIIGVQILWNCTIPSLAVAKVCEADYIRVIKLTGQTISPYGILEPNPLEIMNYRKLIDAQDVEIIAEIYGYHNKADDIIPSIADKAMEVMRVGADAVEIYHPDEEVNSEWVHLIKTTNSTIPVILGGGTNLINVRTLLAEADGAFVGSCFEKNDQSNSIDENIVKDYMRVVRSLK